MSRFIVGNLLGVAATLLFIGTSAADDPKGPVMLAVVGSPAPDAAFGDARHCPLTAAPVAKASGDRLEFSLAAKEPTSITLTARRGGNVCGGSLYVVPQSGLGFAARLTPGDICAAQLFRIDPHAQPPVQLLQTDNHPELNELLCATQQGSQGTSRLALGRNVRGSTVRLEIGSGGDCSTFEHVSPGPSGIELHSAGPQWLRLKFRATAGMGGGGAELIYCDLSIKFTPDAGAAYLIDASGDSARCEMHLMKADAQGNLSPTAFETIGKDQCKATK